MLKNNDISVLIKKRNELDEKIKIEKLKLFEMFTLEFLSLYNKTLADVPMTKKDCHDFIKKTVSESINSNDSQSYQ